MMDERATTNSHHQQQYETFQQRRQCWLVFGRTVLTLSVLGLLTIGLYVGSNRIHLVSGESVNDADDPAHYVPIRERREAAQYPSNGPESKEPWTEPINVPVPPLKQRPAKQPRKPRKRPLKLPKKTNPANRYGNETTDYIYIDTSGGGGGAGHQNHHQLYPHNLTDNGEIYQLGENVLQHHPNGATTIESVLHVRRYKCYKHPHMHMRGELSVVFCCSRPTELRRDPKRNGSGNGARFMRCCKF